jgi:glycosyltransferase involved in cell wall biosynthesis
VISAIVPTFNRAELLVRALRSIAAQTLRPDEVWVVDDGSTDGTAERVAREFPSVRCVRQENRGVSAARNRGIASARGEWLAFLDSDDEWQPTKLEEQMDALGRSPGARFCHTDEIWIRNGRRVNPGRRHAKRGGWIFRDCLPLCAISPSAALMHRSVIERVGPFDESLAACEDYDMWLRVCCRYPVVLAKEPLVVKHGGHAGQLSTTTWGLDRFRIRALEKILEEGELTPADRLAAQGTLAEKLRVFSAGAARRGRCSEAAGYERRLERLERELAEAGPA